MPAYRDDPKRMEDLLSPIFATPPTWADVQNLLNTLLTSEEHRMVLDKARDEADLLHAETPGNPVKAAACRATPKADPDGM